MAAVNRKPIDFGLRVRRPSPRLMITAANKIKRGQEILLRFAGQNCQGLEVPLNGSEAEANRLALNDLISSLPPPFRPSRAAVRSHFVWQNVPPSHVLAYLEAFTAYRDSSFLASPNCKCDAICRYIREREEAGELSNWTVCLVSKSTGNAISAQIGGIEVSLVHRKRIESGPGRFRVNALVGRAEEAVDLTDPEFDAAVQLTNDRLPDEAKKEKAPGREEVREIRPRERGLLLLYPLLPRPPKQAAQVPDDPDFQRANYVVSAAISFPASPGAAPVPYMVNPVWMQEYRYIVEDDDVDS